MNATVCRWLAFSVTVAAVVLIWTVVLPWLSTQHAVRARIDLLDEQGIDPAALYYTDLDVMAELEANLAALRTEHPEAFWLPSTR